VVYVASDREIAARVGGLWQLVAFECDREAVRVAVLLGGWGCLNVCFNNVGLSFVVCVVCLAGFVRVCVCVTNDIKPCLSLFVQSFYFIIYFMSYQTPSDR
jgi:hypothetical protein